MADRLQIKWLPARKSKYLGVFRVENFEFENLLFSKQNNSWQRMGQIVAAISWTFIINSYLVIFKAIDSSLLGIGISYVQKSEWRFWAIKSNVDGP